MSRKLLYSVSWLAKAHRGRGVFFLSPLSLLLSKKLTRNANTARMLSQTTIHNKSFIHTGMKQSYSIKINTPAANANN
jgi:hypothetical protein